MGEQGTPHLQFYVAGAKKITFKCLKKVFPRAHLLVCKGTPQQNLTYCSKDGDFVTWGDLPMAKTAKATKAAKDKWDEVKELAINGDLDSIDSEVFIKHYSTLKRIRSDHRMKARLPTLDWSTSPNVWIYGPPGVGKSRRARLDYPDAYIKAPQNKWWGGYNDEPVVLIDDLRLDQDYQLSNLITWADRYPFQAEIKADSTGMIRPRVIVLTSNFHPNQIWKLPEDINSILRRFRVVHMEQMEQFDATTSMKKRKVVEEDTPEKPPLFRQNATGNLVPYVDLQPKITKVFDLTSSVTGIDMELTQDAETAVIDLTDVDNAIAEATQIYKMCDRCGDKVIECSCDMANPSMY